MPAEEGDPELGIASDITANGRAGSMWVIFENSLCQTSAKDSLVRFTAAPLFGSNALFQRGLKKVSGTYSVIGS